VLERNAEAEFMPNYPKFKGSKFLLIKLIVR